MGFIGFIESLLPNYIASLLPSSDMVGGLVVIWCFIAFYMVRWWLTRFGKRWNEVKLATVLGAVVLIGLFWGSISVARSWSPRAQNSDLDFAWYEAVHPQAGKPFNVNVHPINRGSLKAFGLQFGGGIGFTNQPITDAFANQKFDISYSKLAQNPPIVGNEIQPGSDQIWFTVDGPTLNKRKRGSEALQIICAQS